MHPISKFRHPSHFSKLFLLAIFTLILVLSGCRQDLIIKEIPYTNTVLATSTPNTNQDFEKMLLKLESRMPAAHTNLYLTPNPVDQKTFQKLITAIGQDNLPYAKQIANSVNYKLLDLTDSGNATSEGYVLEEFTIPYHGWGTYIFRAASTQDIVIEAPHPVTDENTVKVAIHLYRSLSAKALLVAGARRDTNDDDSADVAHASRTIFQTVHEALFNQGGQPDTNTIFLQIHGYDSDTHSDLPEVVIGYNWQNDVLKDELLSRIVKAMEANHLTVGTCHDQKYRGVCGTQNIQRQITGGGIFLHLELSAELRVHDTPLILALQQAFTR